MKKTKKRRLILGLAALALIVTGAGIPYYVQAKARAQRISCICHLKQIGIALRLYATDNKDRFPWLVPQAEGGSAEFMKPGSDESGLLDLNGNPVFDANAWRHFQVLSNPTVSKKALIKYHIKCANRPLPASGERWKRNRASTTG